MKRTDKDNYFSRNIGIVKKLKNNFKAIGQYTKIYDGLCPHCKSKVLRNPTINLKCYCKKCQKMALVHLKIIKEEIK